MSGKVEMCSVECLSTVSVRYDLKTPKLILGKDAKNGFSRNILTILGAPGLLLFDGEALVGTEYLVLI